MKFTTVAGAIDVSVKRLIVAGWTGRDKAAVNHHIAELAEIGVPPPSATPVYYRASAAMLTQTARLEALGSETSGEAEPLIVAHDGALWLGLASDHTDRGLEAHSIAHSKQICGKVAAARLWRLADIAAPDEIEFRSWIREDGEWRLYQDGKLGAILPLTKLIAGAGVTDGDAMLCGTLSAIGGVRPAPAFRMKMTDPATDLSIEHEYEIAVLPVIA